jgi:hypothetical protein
VPVNILKHFAQKSGKDISEIEPLWSKAKDIVKKQYPKVSDKDDNYYEIVVGVLKKMLKVEDAPSVDVGGSPVMTTSTIGTLGPGPILARYQRNKSSDKIPDKMKKNKKKPCVIHDYLGGV